jgi:hypothetical protein
MFRSGEIRRHDAGIEYTEPLDLPFPRRSLLAFTALGSIFRVGELRAAQARKASGPIFEEVPSGTSGITWVHENAKSPERYLPESLGPGCAFLDYDNDGWMDIYLVNSGPSDFYSPKQPLRNALYKNNRDGTFTDVTEKAGLAVPGWTTSAVWFDYDNDGRLDLFVCSFVDYTNKPSCGVNKAGQRYYCIPRLFKPTHSFLFHNNGDGTFTDVTRGTAIERAMGKGLGVVATDINNDGRMDLFVANDTVQDFLWGSVACATAVFSNGKASLQCPDSASCSTEASPPRAEAGLPDGA